ncbi:MAG: right-handed parallel beta-helix repeat-containing protein [Bdellovibrionota bacterium]
MMGASKHSHSTFAFALLAAASMFSQACLFQSKINADLSGSGNSADPSQDGLIPISAELITSSGPFSATIEWPESLSGTQFTFRFRPEGETMWTELANQSESSITLINLEQGQNYVIQARGIEGGQPGDWSESKRFEFSGEVFSSQDYSGNTYYVSNDGSDSNPGTEASPIGSLSKVQTILNNAVGPTNILFKRGDVWKGTLTLPSINNTNSSNRVRLGAYESGDLPQIIGSENIRTSKTWTASGGNMFYATVSVPEPGALFVDQELTYPAKSALIEIQSGTATSITADFLKGKNFVGKFCLHRGEHWNAERQTITAHNGTSGTVSWNEVNNPNSGKAGNGFYITNDSSFVDEAGEWWYDVNTSRLYYKTNGQLPNSDFRIPQHNYGLVINGNNYEISDLDLRYFHKDAIFVTGSNVRIQYSNISHNYNSGIFVDGTISNLEVKNNHIHHISGVGLYGYQSSNSEAAYNHVHNIAEKQWGEATGVEGGGQASNNQFGSGMTWKSVQNNYIHHNRVHDTGYNGIRIDGRNHLIEYNYVYDGLKQLGDGGLIYTFEAGSATYPTENNTIQYNIVENTEGNNTIGYNIGTPYSSIKLLTNNIYLDNGSDNTVVKGNIMKGCVWNCVLLNFGTTGNTVEENIMYADTRLIQISKGNDSIPSNHTIRNNVFISSGPNAYAMYLVNQGSYPWDPGNFSGNTYISPYSNIVAKDQNNPSQTNYTFSQWTVGRVGESGAQNLHSGKSYVSEQATASELKLLINRTSQNQTIDLSQTYEDLDAQSVGSSITLTPFSAEILFGF